ncbi:MAG: pyruvate dehydrogenase (acetyl-transferring) E1 component subunit alpha [Candidatus Bipolaricaulia bacterium]
MNQQGLLQIIAEDGSCNPDLEPELDVEALRYLYKTIVLTREVDRKALSLQRQGRISVYIPCEGQEAAAAGSAYTLSPGDWLFPYPRDLAALLIWGYPIGRQLAWYMGYPALTLLERWGPSFPEGSIRYVGPYIPIATQIPHAVGTAWAAKLRGDQAVTLVYFGDGATSEGDFHEALNFAGVFQVPIVFFCENNQYAISVPIERQTASESLAIKAVAYGFSGEQVDGNDVLAIYRATKAAVDKARAGGGPTLIEAVTYRIGPHTTSDDPMLYQRPEEIERWRARDPIIRFRRYLEAKDLWNDSDEAELHAEAERRFAEAIAEVEALPKRLDPELIFEQMYAELPPILKEQRESMIKYLKQEAR